MPRPSSPPTGVDAAAGVLGLATADVLVGLVGEGSGVGVDESMRTAGTSVLEVCPTGVDVAADGALTSGAIG
jgi:hypothetical protein